MNLKALSPQQLLQLRNGLKKFFYTAGINADFNTAFENKHSLKFKEKVTNVIREQILHLAQLERVTVFTQRQKALINTEDKVKKEWISFVDKFPGGKIGLFGFLAWAGTQGGQSALEKLNSNKTFVLTNKNIYTKLDERVNFLIKTLDATGIKWATNVIENGLKQKMSNAELVNFLKEKAEEVAKHRGEVITETELITAMNIVELETYKRNGIGKVKWVTSGDERTCPICLGNETKGILKTGDVFPSGHVSPPAHVLCRCFNMPVDIKNINIAWRGE